MRIAIASGKGGTGKTTVATNLALVIAGRVEFTVCGQCAQVCPAGAITV